MGFTQIFDEASHARSIAAVNRLIEIDGRIAKLSLESVVALLKARRAEKDFFLFRTEFGFKEAKSRYATLVQTNVADISQYMTEIRGLTGNQDVVELTHAVEQGANHYQVEFLEVINLYRKLGYINDGLEGDFRKKAHEIESIIAPRNLDRLMLDLLHLRRAEKDFHPRNLDKNVKAFTKGIDRFKADIALTSLPPALKKKLQTLVVEYNDSFQQYVQTDSAINASKVHFITEMHAIEPLLEKLYFSATQAEMTVNQDVREAAKTTAWAIAFATLLGLPL